MLTFEKDSDFEAADSFELQPNGSVVVRKGTWQGLIDKGDLSPRPITGYEPVLDEEGKVVPGEQGDPIYGDLIDVFARLEALDASATSPVTLIRPTSSEQDAYDNELAANQAARAKDELKRDGADINGHIISLDEANQNGLAALKAGDDLAIEAGGTIFPINFSARTKNGYVTVPFATRADFTAFSLAFIQARQQFFQ